MNFSRQPKRLQMGALALLALGIVSAPALAADINVEDGHLTLVKLPQSMGEVIVADPSVADVRAHGTYYLSIIGKHTGDTSIRIFNRQHELLQSYDVHVGYDLVAVRKALKDFLPDELIGVEMINRNIAVTGQVSSAQAADRALSIVREFIDGGGDDAGAAAKPAPIAAAPAAAGAGAGAAGGKSGGPDVLNLMQVSSGQQVMLRVRVGEIQRSALKNLGVNLSALGGSSISSVGLATGAAGLTGFLTPASALGGSSAAAYGPGHFIFPSDSSGIPSNTQGIITGRWQPSGPNGPTLAGALQALEQDGLFKLLAEPNLVAVSGEQAEFLAGGEIPVPVPQSGGVGTTTVTIDYKPFGVGVKFKPVVLNENLIRMEVQPEVSELDPADGITLDSFSIPAISTRRAKTTVELAPGESFMIAGLIKDQAQSTINQLPGVKDLPILGALFRSTEFQRNETELVIAVTPYIVNPMKSSSVRLPTDNFAPASDMDMIFYGSLGAITGNKSRTAPTPSVEGPIGFMAD